MEVGPLARVLMLYAKGHEPTRALADQALRTLDLPLTALFSTLGRTAARTLESKLFADQMMGWLDQLVARIKGGDASVHLQRSRCGTRPPGRARPRAWASWKRRAARCATTWSSRTA
jgi:Ni,Fe-hydrogenase I large subunit